MDNSEMIVHDRRGRPLAPGHRVRVLRDPPLEGEVRRVVPRYSVLTVIVAAKAGKTERMVRAAEVELLEGGPVVGTARQDVVPASTHPSRVSQ